MDDDRTWPEIDVDEALAAEREVVSEALRFGSVSAVRFESLIGEAREVTIGPSAADDRRRAAAAHDLRRVETARAASLRRRQREREAAARWSRLKQEEMRRSFAGWAARRRDFARRESFVLTPELAEERTARKLAVQLQRVSDALRASRAREAAFQLACRSEFERVERWQRGRHETGLRLAMLG